MKKSINSFLLFTGFVFLSVLYYWQMVLIGKPMVYGFVSGLARAMLILSGFGYFWLLVKQLPFLNNLRQRFNKYRSAKNRGRDAIALTLGIIHMTVVYFGAVAFNHYLLNSYGKLTSGVIKDCRQNRQGEYCLYQYAVNNKLYQISITNEMKKYKEQDTITVLYYPKWPVISVLK